MAAAAAEIPFVPLPSGSATCTVHPLVNATLTDYEHITLSPAPSSAPGRPVAYLEPTFSFFIEHRPSGKRLLFDVGVRWDYESAFPQEEAREFREFYGARIVGDVGGMLEQGGVDPASIDYILFSHEHWDHTGLIGPLPTAALVGGRATFAADLLAQMRAAGRAPTVVDFERDGRAVGAYERGVDWFGDGSVWLCHTPGHTKDHMSALVRTTAPSAADAEAESYVLLGGDVAHHPCLLCTRASHAHFALVARYRNPLLPPTAAEEEMHYSPALARDSIARTRRMEREGNVMCVLAHEFGAWGRWQGGAVGAGVMWPGEEGLTHWMRDGLKGTREYGTEVYDRVEPHAGYLAQGKE